MFRVEPHKTKGIFLKTKPNTTSQKNDLKAGSARVMLWKEAGFREMDPVFSTWGKGFFDFGRTLQVLNSQGMSSEVEGHYEDEFFVLSDPTDKAFY